MTRIRVSHVHRSNPSFSIFESDRSVGRRSAVRPVGDRSLRQQSHGRRRSRRGRFLPRWDRRHPFTFRRPTHLARRVANHDRRCRPSYRWAASATTRHTRPMTTPVTVSQSTRQPEARTIPPRPAIVAAPGGRRGEAPGRRTSRRVPASPTISAGDRYRTGESSVIGAAPAVRPTGGRSRRRRSPDSRQRVPRRDGSPRRRRARARHRPLRGRSAPAAPPSLDRRARARSIINSPRTAVGRTPGPTAVAAVRSPSASARPRGGPALGRTRTVARAHTRSRHHAGERAGARAARACCKTEIPG